MMEKKIKDYQHENSTLIITVLVNLRNIFKFDFLRSFRTGEPGIQPIYINKTQCQFVYLCVILMICGSVYATQQTIFLKIFPKFLFQLLGMDPRKVLV